MKGCPVHFRCRKSSAMFRSDVVRMLAWIGLPVVATLMSVVFMVTAAAGQSSSLYEKFSQQRPLSARDASFHWSEVEPPKEFQLHDIVTVLVDYKSQVISEGEMDRKKKADGALTLSDWIVFDGWAIRPDPQTPGDPKVGGQVQNKYKAEGNLELRDSMKFTIACTVVDKRPNGHLVIEGHYTIQNNNEKWEMSLGGTIRPEDVLPDNTVLSEKVANMRINKREAGHVRDGYRRGWMLRWLDKYQPF